MSVDQYVEHAIQLRIEYLQKLLRVTGEQRYLEITGNRREQWKSELSALKIWLDCRMPKVPRAG